MADEGINQARGDEPPMTDSTTDITRIIAFAICQEGGCEDPDCDCPYLTPDKTEGRQAQAVLQALDEAGLVVVPREPDEAMKRAGGNVSGTFQGTGAARGNAVEKWQAMIQAYKGEKRDG